MESTNEKRIKASLDEERRFNSAKERAALVGAADRKPIAPDRRRGAPAGVHARPVDEQHALMIRAKAEEYKRFVRRVGEWAGCLICADNTRIDPAHIKFSDAAAGKTHPGHSAKDDDWMVPLCRDCHDLQHKEGNERSFWGQRGIDILKIAAFLKIAGDNDDHEAGCQIIEGARK